jgi:hypothetical protein
VRDISPAQPRAQGMTARQPSPNVSGTTPSARGEPSSTRRPGARRRISRERRIAAAHRAALRGLSDVSATVVPTTNLKMCTHRMTRPERWHRENPYRCRRRSWSHSDPPAAPLWTRSTGHSRTGQQRPPEQVAVG